MKTKNKDIAVLLIWEKITIVFVVLWMVMSTLGFALASLAWMTGTYPFVR